MRLTLKLYTLFYVRTNNLGKCLFQSEDTETLGWCVWSVSDCTSYQGGGLWAFSHLTHPSSSFFLLCQKLTFVVLSALDAVRRQTQEKSCCCSCGEGVQPVLEGTCSPSLPIFLYWNRQWHQWSYLPCPLCVLSCSPCPLPCCSTSVCAVVRWKGWGDGLVRKRAAFP